MRHTSLIAAATLLLLVSIPAPAQTAQAWNNWVYRANSLLKGIEGGDAREIGILCRDIYSEMAGKRFPEWATHLTDVCDALKEGTAKGTTRKFCRSARAAAAHLGAATPVDGEPRAHRAALQLSSAMQGLHDGLCR